MIKNEIEFYISRFDKNRNPRQVKIDLYIHYLIRINNNLTIIQKNLKPKHKNVLIKLYKHLSHIINKLLMVIYSKYSYTSINYQISLPHYSLIHNLNSEIIIQTSIESTIIIIEALKKIYNVIPHDKSIRFLF